MFWPTDPVGFPWPIRSLIGCANRVSEAEGWVLRAGIGVHCLLKNAVPGSRGKGAPPMASGGTMTCQPCFLQRNGHTEFEITILMRAATFERST